MFEYSEGSDISATTTYCYRFPFLKKTSDERTKVLRRSLFYCSLLFERSCFKDGCRVVIISLYNECKRKKKICSNLSKLYLPYISASPEK